MNNRIQQKWGFGMAPTKPPLQEKRLMWVENVLGILVGNTFREDSPEAVSEVKGLFNRVLRQDQWDWFTVFQQLGCPGRIKCKNIAHSLVDLRHVVTGKCDRNLSEITAHLLELNADRYLNLFLEKETSERESEKIYILSTREQPKILKIGFTTRSVVERVNGINAATGVLVPFGVRAVWSVKQAHEIEKKLHANLSEYRIRADREFFGVAFHTAFKLINRLLIEARIEEE